jgi:hypothetical protein
VGCTIVAANYLPFARVLRDGWERKHRGAPLRILVIDGDPGAAGEGLDVLPPEGLGLPPGELGRLRGIYGPAELATALKPHLLRLLLDEGAEAVIFLDSDSDVHAPLDGVAALAARATVALSVHFLEPPPLDGLSPSELEKATTGIFNSGVIAVGPAAGPFLEWWASRLRRDGMFCDPLGTHADQRWLDFVPSYFDHAVIRDPGVNVAHWNLHERPVLRSGGALTAGGVPLRTFHFAGFDPEAPDQLSRYGWWTPLRTGLVDHPDLADLCRDYAARLLAAGYREARAQGYPYARAASGRALGAWERQAYREILLAAEARGRDVPDPFDASRASEFDRMLDDPEGTGLLSADAAARLLDARVARPRLRGDRRDPLRALATFGWQAARRLPIRRRGWWPYPIAADRTLREYGGGASPGDHGV